MLTRLCDRCGATIPEDEKRTVYVSDTCREPRDLCKVCTHYLMLRLVANRPDAMKQLERVTA